MACNSLPAGLAPVCPADISHDAPPEEHVLWSQQLADYCGHRAGCAFELADITSLERWLQAERIARFAAMVWRERVKGVA
jgi:hypothetical protein